METGTKEEAAAFFRGLVGKDAAIESAESASAGTGQFYIGVDFMATTSRSSRFRLESLPSKTYPGAGLRVIAKWAKPGPARINRHGVVARH
jgi:hypothetical protein